MAEIDAFYINLESAGERRECLEASFRDSGFSPAWRLHRFNALTPQSDVVKAAEGMAPEKIKANYLSHIGAIRRSLDFDSHAFIVEDDTVFGPQTEFWLRRFVEQQPEDGWDYVLTDIYVADATVMPKLLKIRQKCLEQGRLMVRRLPHWDGPYAGAGAYLINRKSKQKFLDQLADLPIHQAYDLYLRRFSFDQMLTGHVTFPFLTSISALSDQSQIQSDASMIEATLFHYFRRLTWMGADNRPETIDRIKSEITHFAGHAATKEAEALSALLAPLLSLQMSWDMEF